MLGKTRSGRLIFLRSAVLVDRSHFSWASWCIGVTFAALIFYWIYAQNEPNGPSGGSWQGMLYGVAGTGCMVYAGLLAWRKTVPKSQLGTAKAWLRGHIWIGLLSVPLILCHCGFRWGGLLEKSLMVTFALVILSGIYGLIAQQLLPRLMTSTSPAQAIAAQLNVACERLRRDTEIAVQAACTSEFLEPLNSRSKKRKLAEVATTGSAAHSSEESTVKEEEPEQTSFSPRLELATFYWDQLDSFLRSDAKDSHELANPTLAKARFGRLRDSVTADLLELVDDMQAACDERRQLLFQAKIHWWLHGWLNIHIPLSVTLLVLGLCHIITAIYY